MKQYDPSKVVHTYGGNILSGFADGVMCTAKRTSDAQMLHMGTDGRGTVVKSADKSGEITIKLAASSSSNDILSAIYAQQELGPLVPLPFFVKDLFGTTIIFAQNSWIKKLPDVEFGKELSDREWVFGCENLTMNVGGNL